MSQNPKGTPYSQNHYVPRLMLKTWEVQQRGRHGVHVYNVRTKEFAFERSRGRRPFAFAAVEDLYVPLVDGRRATALERWFSSHESVLARLIGVAESGGPVVTVSAADFTKFGKALFGLEQRSRYKLARIQEHVTNNPDHRELISASPERDVDRLVLENLAHFVDEHFARYSPLEVTFTLSKGPRFVISDQPGFSDPRLPQRLLVLGNRLAVYYEKGNQDPFIDLLDADDAFIELINRHVAMGARDWIVAESTQDLQRYAAINSSPEAVEYRRGARVKIMPPTFLTSGRTIPPDAG